MRLKLDFVEVVHGGAPQGSVANIKSCRSYNIDRHTETGAQS